MEIYYFSGTGNSLHVCKELQRRFPNASLIPMVGLLGHARTASTSEVVGIAFPIHCLGLPGVVIEFLRRADLRSARYIFAIATRECSSRVFSAIDRILRRQGKSLAASFSVQMPETYIPMFEMTSAQENAAMESAMLSKLAAVQSAVENKQTSLEHDRITAGLLVYYALSPVVRFLFTRTRYFGIGNAFYADENCTGCGRCATICLSGRIHIENRRPVWDRGTRCLVCFACLHYCPAHAVQIRNRKTATRGRYHHPEVRAEEIAEQKAQR